MAHEPSQSDITEERLAELELSEGVEGSKLIGARANDAADDELYFDLNIRPPIGISVRRFAKKAGQQKSALREAEDGYLDVLLFHGITPSPKDGQSPRGIWGLGYEASFPDQPDIRTKDWSPADCQYRIGGISQEAQFHVALGGGVKDAGARLSEITGLPITEFDVRAFTDHSFDLSLRFQLELLEIVAGPTSADN